MRQDASKNMAIKSDDRKDTKLSMPKNQRLLMIYKKLLDGGFIKKSCMARDYNVSERTIQRDLRDIELFLAEERVFGTDGRCLVFDASSNSYCLGRKVR